jgi:hypothetical protein
VNEFKGENEIPLELISFQRSSAHIAALTGAGVS